MGEVQTSGWLRLISTYTFRKETNQTMDDYESGGINGQRTADVAVTGNVNATPELMASIQKAINTYDMLTDGDSVVVGLSGGADSFMLTHYLKFALCLPVYACHVNHMLRGEESVRDMEFVTRICKQWDIPLMVESVDVTNYAQQNKLTIEQAGREVRYTMFEQAREHFNATKIATAHTLSDSAETVLLNLTRGTALHGLCGIPPARGNIIRPIIHLTRTDVEQYCSENAVSYVIDSTNLQRVYTRNKIRIEVLPKLIEVNPQLYSAIGRTLSVISDEDEYLAQVAAEAYEQAQRQEVFAEEGLYVSEIAGLHPAIRHRVLAMFLDGYHIEKSHDLITKIDRLVACDKGKINVKPNLFVEIKKHTLLVSDNNNVLDYFEYPVEPGTLLDANGNCYDVKICDRAEIEIIKKIYKKLLYICLDYDKIIGTAIIRQRKSGDKLTLAGRGTKSIKKMLIDDKLTAVQKSEVLVVADEESAVAAMGCGEDARVLPDGSTTRFLIITRKHE